MPRTMIGQQMHALGPYAHLSATRTFMQGAHWHVQARVNTPGVTHQGTAPCRCCWRIIGKADGMLKEGMLERGKCLKEGKVVARKGCTQERGMLRERKTLREGNINGRKTAREERC